MIEVLIAMVILTVALVSMAELMAVTIRMQMLGRNETAAIRMVTAKIDELVAINFFDPLVMAQVAVGGSLTGDVTVGAVNFFDDPAAGFHRRWQITAIAGQTRIRTLTVRVIPRVVDRRTNAEVQLTTIIRSP
jgi:hypothetical protein